MDVRGLSSTRILGDVAPEQIQIRSSRQGVPGFTDAATGRPGNVLVTVLGLFVVQRLLIGPVDSVRLLRRGLGATGEIWEEIWA